MLNEPLDYLVSVFGSQKAIADALGIGKNAVSMWRRAGVPDGAKWKLLVEAQKREKAIDLARLDPAFRSLRQRSPQERTP